MRNITILLCMIYLFSGCAMYEESAHMLMKAPLVAACQRIPTIKGCPEIADGVIDLADKKEDEARSKLQAAIKKNEPKQLEMIIKVIDEVMPNLHIQDFLAGKKSEALAVKTKPSEQPHIENIPYDIPNTTVSAPIILPLSDNKKYSSTENPKSSEIVRTDPYTREIDSVVKTCDTKPIKVFVATEPDKIYICAAYTKGSSSDCIKWEQISKALICKGNDCKNWNIAASSIDCAYIDVEGNKRYKKECLP